jgi:DNA-directed RNA polymerase subunit RPC12/RpoP
MIGGQNDWTGTKELAERVVAEELLISRGYVKAKCDRCGGRVTNILGVYDAMACSQCNGKGWVWKAPLMR